MIIYECAKKIISKKTIMIILIGINEKKTHVNSYIGPLSDILVVTRVA